MQILEWLVKKKERLSKRYRCMCCENFTLGRGEGDICPVCGWDNYIDEYDEPDPEIFQSSLEEAKANYREFGAASRQALRTVRRPYGFELGQRLDKLGQQVRRKGNHVGILPRIWYGPLLLMVIGVVASIFMSKSVVSTAHFNNTAVLTYGKTVSERLVHGWPEIMMGNDPYYTRMVTVEFNTVEKNQVFHFEVGSDKLGLNQRVEVVYDPSNPQRAEIKGWRSDLGLEIGLLVLSLCCVGIGFLWMT